MNIILKETSKFNKYNVTFRIQNIFNKNLTVLKTNNGKWVEYTKTKK